MGVLCANSIFKIFGPVFQCLSQSVEQCLYNFLIGLYHPIRNVGVGFKVEDVTKPLWRKKWQDFDITGHDKVEKDQKGSFDAREKWSDYIAKWDPDQVGPMHLQAAAEEYEEFPMEHDPIDDIFDEPDRPIGAFDEAEVAYHVEVERQKLLKEWKASGATPVQLEAFQQQHFSMSSAELDKRGNEAREALIADCKLC